MPEDTKYIINQSQLVDIADAIREKYGEQDTYKVNEMPRLIENIPGAPICTVTVKNISTTDDLSEGEAASVFGNETAFYDEVNNVVKYSYIFTQDIDENSTIAPLGTKQYKVLTIPYSPMSNQKSGTKGTTSEYPSSYFGYDWVVSSSDYSDFLQNLVNVSVAVVKKEETKSEEYDIIPYPTDPTKNSSFTVNLGPITKGGSGLIVK